MLNLPVKKASFLWLLVFGLLSCQPMEDSLNETPDVMRALQCEESSYEERCRSYTPQNNLPPNPLWNIPVVVHMIQTSGMPEISDEQICEQIHALNEGFRLSHIHVGHILPEYQALAVDTRINFSLDYIIRKCPDDPPLGAFQLHTCDVVEISPRAGANTAGVNRERYLHVWVADFENNNCGNIGARGQSFISLGDGCTTEDLEVGCLEGIMINFRGFGVESPHLCPNASLGRTLVHEAGHWLGLNHTFEDTTGGDDCVDDTICPGIAAFSDCDGQLELPCNTIGFPNHPRMFQNFMGGSISDPCRLFFTRGQKERMYDHLCLGRPEFSLTQPTPCFN